MEISYRNRLMQLQSPWSPTTRHVQLRSGKASRTSRSEAKGFRTGGVTGVSPGVWAPENPETQGLKAGEGGCPSSKVRKNSPSLGVFVQLGPSKDWWMPDGNGKDGSFSPQSSDSDANLFWRHPHRQTPKSCCTSYLGVPYPVKLVHKISRHKQ